MLRISVIIPCYNYGKFLPECIDSLLAQTFSDYEAIIVDDCSNDGKTPAIITEQAKRDKRIRIITHPKNKGLSATRNTGIDEAKAEYILSLDADDKIKPNYLKKLLEKIEAENADVAYPHAQYFGKSNYTKWAPKNQKAFNKIIPFKCPIVSTSLYKKSCWEEVGGYDENLKGYEDWDFWLYFVEKNKKMTLADDVFLDYRAHEGSMVVRNIAISKQLFKQMKEKHPNLYKGLQYYCNFNYFKYVIRPALFQLRTRKGRRIFRLLGITFYED